MSCLAVFSRSVENQSSFRVPPFEEWRNSGTLEDAMDAVFSCNADGAWQEHKWEEDIEGRRCRAQLCFSSANMEIKKVKLSCSDYTVLQGYANLQILTDSMQSAAWKLDDFRGKDI